MCLNKQVRENIALTKTGESTSLYNSQTGLWSINKSFVPVQSIFNKLKGRNCALSRALEQEIQTSVFATVTNLG